MSTFTVKLWKSLKMIKFECKLDLQVFSWWMELRSISHFEFWPKSHTHPLQKLSNWLILIFVFIHCKIVEVSQNDKIRLQTWSTRVLIMNETELRSLSHFKILTGITSSDLSRNLENWLILKFVFIYCKTVQVSQTDQIRM